MKNEIKTVYFDSREDVIDYIKKHKLLELDPGMPGYIIAKLHPTIEVTIKIDRKSRTALRETAVQNNHAYMMSYVYRSIIEQMGWAFIPSFAFKNQGNVPHLDAQFLPGDCEMKLELMHYPQIQFTANHYKMSVADFVQDSLRLFAKIPKGLAID